MQPTITECNQQRTGTGRIGRTVVGAGWLFGVACGMHCLWSYESTPGPTAVASATWPDRSGISRSEDRFTLLLFAHPRCPCTRASVAELSRLMDRCRDQIDARVLLYTPANAAADWPRTEIWQSAEAIPGVSVVPDREGAEARCFAATTSGSVLLYDRRGRRVFSGGITISRGHRGTNPGGEAIAAIVNGDATPKRTTPVFGCPIRPAEGKGSEL